MSITKPGISYPAHQTPHGNDVGETKCQKEFSQKKRHTHTLVEENFSQNSHSLFNLTISMLKENLQNTFRSWVWEQKTRR